MVWLEFWSLQDNSSLCVLCNEKFELKTKTEVDELKDDKASAEFGNFDIGCLLKTTQSSF